MTFVQHRLTDEVEEAVKYITRFYRNFHSSRFVKDRMVIRLQNAPSPSALRALNEDFAHITGEGGIQVIEPTKEELDDEDCVSLPRLGFQFDRRSYGRLRLLVDRLNAL